MINVKEAVNAAYNYLAEMSDLIKTDLADLRLEEIERSEDERFWLVTLGYDRALKNNLLPALGLPERLQYQREYKLLKVNAETGEVEALKIREV
jgi:hypothetical protein